MGTASTTGYTNGYTLSGGDDFDGALSLVNPSNQAARYFTTRVGRPPNKLSTSKARSASAYYGYYVDPYHTGATDGNRGVPLPEWAVSHTQASSVLKLNTRTASAGAKALFDGAFSTQDMSMAGINTVGFFAAQAPCIIELKSRTPDLSIFSGTHATNGAGFHLTYWTLQTGPAFEGNNWESDFEVFDHKSYNIGWNEWNNGVDVNAATIVTTPLSTSYKIFSMELLPAKFVFYVDGVKTGEIAKDLTLYGNRPFYIFITNAIWNDPAYEAAAWSAIPGGIDTDVEFIRFWRLSSAPHIAPLVGEANKNVDFNTAFSYTLPSSATVWGAAATGDTLEMIQNESKAPSGQGQQDLTTFMPAGVTYTGGVLAGTISDRPGAIYFARYGTAVGSTSVPQRFAINVGPRILTATQSWNVGTPVSYDLYADCDVGDLLPKAIVVTGLPAGLSFSTLTGLITGTPTGSASSGNVSVTVTNCVGQAKTNSIAYGVTSGSGLSPTLDNTPTTTVFTATSGTTTVSTTTANALVLIWIYCGAAGSHVTSITDVAGLTWLKRTSILNGSDTAELWYAVAPTVLTADTITINLSASSGCRQIVFAVKNADTTTPFDTDASLPAQTTASSSPASRTVSTNHSRNMMIAYLRSTTSLGTVTQPTGWTNLGAANANHRADYQVVSVVQSSVAETYSWTGGNTAQALIIDSIRGS